MIIRKISNDYNSYNIDLIQNGKVLSIYQVGEDISFSCRYEDYRKISNISFSISHNQEELYCKFNKLYVDIVNGNVLGEEPNIQRVQERMRVEKCMSWYQSLVRNGVITMHSDDYPINCPNVLKIMKTDDEITLAFDKTDGKIPKMPYCISIGIRQSGSRIYDFCIPFKTLFKQLQNVEEKKEPIKSLVRK